MFFLPNCIFVSFLIFFEPSTFVERGFHIFIMKGWGTCFCRLSCREQRHCCFIVYILGAVQNWGQCKIRHISSLQYKWCTWGIWGEGKVADIVVISSPPPLLSNNVNGASFQLCDCVKRLPGLRFLLPKSCLHGLPWVIIWAGCFVHVDQFQ